MNGILNFSEKNPLVSDWVFSSEDIRLLHREVTFHGWEKGFLRFLSGIPSDKTLPVTGVIRERQASWKFLLDLSGLKKVLVVDTTIGTVTESLAPHCDKLYCIHPDQAVLECIAERLKEKNFDNVHFIHVAETTHLPFQDDFFDLVVFHNIEGVIPHILAHSGDVKKRLICLLAEARRVSGISGTLLVSLNNRFDFNSIRRKFTAGSLSGYERNKFSSSFVNKYIKRAGFNHVDSLYAYPSLENVNEIIDPSMSANKARNTLSIKNLAKVNLLTSKVFAPAFISVASQKPYKSFIENLMEHSVPDAKALKIDRYIVDVIIVTRPENNIKNIKGVVIRLPLNDKNYQSCRNNMDNLIGLQKLRGQIPFKTPSPVKCGVYGGQAYFMESIINGCAIDTPEEPFHQGFPLAAGILTDFHVRTLKSCRFSNNEYQKLASGSLEDLKDMLLFQGHNTFRADILEQYLKETLLGKEIPLVWQHGDFKFENLLINVNETSVEGIIDWDLSEKEGWPLIDLLHLLASRRKLIERTELIDVMNNVIVPLRFDRMEEDMLGSYMNAIDLKQELLPVMTVMYWLHHVTRRIKMFRKSNHIWLKANVIRPLDLIDSLYLRRL